MSTASAYLTVAGLGVDVIYKDIKNLHISVYPPVGRVRVAAPQRTDEDTIRLAIVQRLPWIKRQREQLQNAERQIEARDALGRDPLRVGPALPARRLAHQRPLQRRGQGQDALGRRRRRAPTPTVAARRLIVGTAANSRQPSRRSWRSGSRSSASRRTRSLSAA